MLPHKTNCGGAVTLAISILGAHGVHKRKIRKNSHWRYLYTIFMGSITRVYAESIK